MSAPSLQSVRGMSIHRALRILSYPLVFGDAIQIEARQFVEFYLRACDLLVEWNDDNPCILAYYHRPRIEAFTMCELADLVQWLETDDD